MSFPADATVSEAGEFPLIERLREVFAQGEQVLVGPGDDAAVLRIRDGHVRGVHRPARRGPALPPRLGLGGRHRAPGRGREPLRHQRDGRPRALADDRAGGARATCRRSGRWTSPRASPRSARWSAPAWSGETSPGRRGGDRGHRARLVHAVAGAPLGRRARRRAGAVRAPGLGGRRARRPRPRLPLAAGAGRGLPPPRAAVRRGPRRRGGRRHLDDRRLRRAARRRRATSPRTPASRSTSAATRSRSPEPLHAVGAATGADPLQFILGGGDDHALLATFPADAVPEGWTVIGSVAEGPGVTVDGAAYDGPTGWTHF